jgi:hypothetical protein
MGHNADGYQYADTVLDQYWLDNAEGVMMTRARMRIFLAEAFRAGGRAVAGHASADHITGAVPTVVDLQLEDGYHVVRVNGEAVYAGAAVDAGTRETAERIRLEYAARHFR